MEMRSLERPRLMQGSLSSINWPTNLMGSLGKPSSRGPYDRLAEVGTGNSEVKKQREDITGESSELTDFGHKAMLRLISRCKVLNERSCMLGSGAPQVSDQNFSNEKNLVFLNHCRYFLGRPCGKARLDHLYPSITTLGKPQTSLASASRRYDEFRQRPSSSREETA